ncbi:MAG: Uma2 family endonuclease [Gemmatimonadaceae bacterium]
MAAASHVWTRAELLELPDDGNRYEVLDGQLLVTPLPSARHQVAHGRLFVEIGAYCHRHSLGVAVTPGPVPHGKSELQPDIAVYLGVPRTAELVWDSFPRAALVVEVLSPSTRRRDLGVKRAAYLKWGIPEYWIVDTDRRTITVVRSNRADEVVTNSLHWQPLPELPALAIALSEVFL